jgi:hypothetical protein
VSILSCHYGLPDIPYEVDRAARILLNWAETQHGIKEWTFYGCVIVRPLVVINSPEEAITGTSQTADSDAEVYRDY